MLQSKELQFTSSHGMMRARRAIAIASPHNEEELEFRASFVTTRER
jgi:hypothetical protein